MMVIIPACSSGWKLPNRSAGQEAKFPVAVIDLRRGAAPLRRRMPSWSTSIVNRRAKSRASDFSAMAAPVSDGWSASDTHQIPFGTSMGFAKGSTHRAKVSLDRAHI